jgi:hypothetical protein
MPNACLYYLYSGKRLRMISKQPCLLITGSNRAFTKYRKLSTQGKGIYHLCSRQSAKILAVSSKQNILVCFWNNQAHSCWATAHVSPSSSPCIENSLLRSFFVSEMAVRAQVWTIARIKKISPESNFTKYETMFSHLKVVMLPTQQCHFSQKNFIGKFYSVHHLPVNIAVYQKASISLANYCHSSGK